MPKLWTETIDSHRREVREAILDITAALVSDRGLRGVTMSQVADEVGIGRATLYKYFGGVEEILLTWHARQVSHHLDLLEQVRDQGGEPLDQLHRALEAYAFSSHGSHGQHDSELVAFLHSSAGVVQAQQQVRALLRDLLEAGVAGGQVRGDVSPDELAGYCQHALGAARELTSKAALRRLVGVTVSGLRP